MWVHNLLKIEKIAGLGQWYGAVPRAPILYLAALGVI